MGEKVASLYVEIGANTDGLNKGLQETKSGLTSASSNFSNFLGVVAKGATAISAVGVTMSKAFELGDQGAQILQTQASFESLLKTVDGAPDTLQQMQAATQNTVSELDLMSSASAFLAGTTGTLGKTFADALPELSAVARAASVLNPAAGDASQAFERLALGIKKAEPELLDELGILLNLNQVFTEYGASVGKSAQDLTKAEKSQAMLNAVLSQGNTLVEQAAGVSVDAAVSIDRMQASVKNAADALLARFAPGIARAADGIYYFLTASEQLQSALSTSARDMAASSVTYTEYRNELKRAANDVGLFVDAAGDLYQVQVTGSRATAKLIQENYLLDQSEWALAKAAGAVGSAHDKLSGGMTMLGQGVEDSAKAWETYGERLTGIAASTGLVNDSMAQEAAMAAGVAAALEGTLSAATLAYNDSLTSLMGQHDELSAQLVDLQERGYSPTSEKVMELTEAINQNEQAQGQLLPQLQAVTSEFVFNQAAASMNSQTQLDLGRALGLVDEQSYALASAVQALTTTYDTNNDTVVSAAESSYQYGDSLLGIARAAQNLQAQGLPITLQAMEVELRKMGETRAADIVASLGQSADDGVQPMQDLSEAAEDVSGSSGDAADAVKDQNSAMNDTQSAASSAKSALDTLKPSVDNVYASLSAAAGAARDLAAGLRSIPKDTKIKVSTEGFSAAIAAINGLSSALNSIPTSITATVNVQTTSGTGGGGTGSGGGQSSIGAAQPEETEAKSGDTIFNVYNPLAAAILARQVGMEAEKRLNALMA